MFFLCVNLYSQQTLKRTAYSIEGIALGSIQNKDANWSDNLIGISVSRKRQWKDQKEISIYPGIEIVGLTTTSNSKVGFKYLLSARGGLGVTLLNHSRLSFPIMVNFGAAFSRVTNASKNLFGVSVGFKGGFNFFLTQRLAIVGNYHVYGNSADENITINSKLIPDRFDYSSHFASIGLLLSFYGEK